MSAKIKDAANVKLDWPSTSGLQIPEGLVCDSKPGIYLDCWWQDWSKTMNFTRYYCDVWGPYRGFCVHISKAGVVMDYNSLRLQDSKNGLSASCETPKGKGQDEVYCYNYEKYQRRSCNIHELSKCESSWKPWRVDIWGDCSYEDTHKICTNQTNTSYRRCHVFNADYWECKAYSMKKEFLYKAFVRDPGMAYYASQVDNPKTDPSYLSSGDGEGHDNGRAAGVAEIDVKDL